MQDFIKIFIQEVVSTQIKEVVYSEKEHTKEILEMLEEQRRGKVGDIMKIEEE